MNKLLARQFEEKLSNKKTRVIKAVPVSEVLQDLQKFNGRPMEITIEGVVDTWNFIKNFEMVDLGSSIMVGDSETECELFRCDKNKIHSASADIWLNDDCQFQRKLEIVKDGFKATIQFQCEGF